MNQGLNLAAVRFAFERILKIEKHDARHWIDPGSMQGFVDLRGACRRCGERWYFAGANHCQDIYAMLDAIGPCRGERLYTPIDGGPWLAYPRAAYEARLP